MTEAKPQNYWISPTALKITLNALSDADYMQASAASGAMIMCYMRGIDGLEYDHGHNYKRWPLKISPTYFTTTTRKYVYIRIPKPAADLADVDADTALVVYPSERVDIYGMTEDGRQLLDASFYYIYTQGIISASEPTAEGLRRRWEQDIVTGTLASDEATEGGGTGEWWRYDPITDMVTFLKTIASATFEYLKAAQAEIHHLNVTGIFDAVKGYIDDLRSHNYQSGLLDGSGFRLTNDNGEGASELEVDLLKVRKKATFMELEIREETFVGGNQHYSPAGSTIYRVEYMDENDQAIGYTVMKVPFLLKRFAFLGRMFNYAARKRIRRQLSSEEWRQVHHFRCYLLADDGTTATRNWWKVGDQPRCQTFNKAVSAQNKRDNLYNWKRDHTGDDPSTPMPDYTTIEGPFETAYYWRLCSNVGSEKLDDGHAYDFIDMPYEGWPGYSETDKRSFRDAGSGIPVAGDTIVCMGNRTDPERMNMISLYTSGNDNNPPAIKGYRGIHTFKINPENKVFEISPNEFLVRSRMFKLLDDSDYEFPVPLERGEWQQGVRYHWYDRVSWKGSIWLCQVLDDYLWEDAAGNNYEGSSVTDIEYGEGEFEYATGKTDHYYRTGRVNGTQVYYIRYYTTSEPDRNNELWLREVSKGTEIVSSEIHYAASLDGVNHPDDEDTGGIDPSTVVVPDAMKSQTTALLSSFAQALAPTAVPVAGSATHEYLSKLYYEARSQYYDGTSPYGLPLLFRKELFPSLTDYYGTDSNPDGAFSALAGVLFAMVLCELRPDLHNAVWKAGYNLGGDKTTFIYKYRFESDQNIARMVGSVLWAAMRGIIQPDTKTMQRELGGSDLGITIREVSDRPFADYKDTYYIDLTQFMPTAPGPYLTGYTDRSSIGGVPYDAYDLADHNLQQDLDIYNLVVSDYNLGGSHHQEVVQAIADKEMAMAHLFGRNRSQNGYSFHPVFGTDTIGKEISDSGATASFVSDIASIGRGLRRPLQLGAYYGRRRPGQSETDGVSKSGAAGVLMDMTIDNIDGSPSGYGREGDYNTHEANSVPANSYPSGHSSGIWAVALMLIEAMPQKAALIMKAANTYAMNRQITRYHWNSDTILGRVAGATIAPMMRASSDWPVLFAAAKAELAQGSGSAWKTTIEETGISMGKYLWTRTTIHYDDPNDPDREPTREYSVARWGIDGDGIAEIDSLYLATSNAALVIDTQADTYPKPGDAGWEQAGSQAKWYATFGDAAAANGGVGAMQGWNVWEKTIIKYDAYNTDGTKKTVPDLVNYRCSRIGQDGQIGEEEYYMLAESDDFATVFGSLTPAYSRIGIRWYNQSNPAAERWRLSDTTPNINTQMWSAVMPTYNKDVHGKKVYLWNFEQCVDGTGTEYATRPVCIGNHARGIKGVIELYALSASQTPVSAERPIPADINAKNQWGVIPTSGFSDPQVWGDEKYDRAPTEALPYQWNWTRTLYSSKDAEGKDYEDHYHVSAVRGTRGEDGAGIEFIYCRPQSHNADGTPIAVTVPDPNVKKDAGGTARTAEYIKTHDDFVPYQWTDNPVGIDFLHQVEYRAERKSSAVSGTGGFTGGHEWGLFSAAAVHSKWGKNGQDGDGVEYVYIRTATKSAPTITNSSDTYGGKTYLDDDYLPLSSAGRCTDDPVGTSHDLPYEWVCKRTKAAPNAETGARQWEKYSGAMALWANFSESITKKSESYRYATNNTGTRPAASSSDWKTTKPTLQKGYWLYTETTITWSDNSTTVLYTDERNPNDGVAGQDIIVDGSTEMKYYVGDSNTSHPAESSSDWKDLSQVTQTQGKWLWSKATTYYRKASSAAGSKDAGHSVNYNVSYISKDGAAGRAVTGITEYYKATNSNAEMPVPTSDSGWSTNPNVSNWGANAKYLWNYEKVTYSSGTTVERTKPQIVAIWTKDGKGIDSITNYYKITSSATAPSRPSTDGSDGWDDDPTAPGAGEYLWNYEKVTYTDGSVFRSEVQLIGHVGKDGQSITKKSESYRYATNNTGTRPAASSSDWKTTKPTLQKGYWLYTETTITWSDNSTTVLYTDERNPNDGVAGQDIIVDGSTEMKYYVGDSNTSHPAESSSDWKDLSQVTQTQGKWLWSKATTYYRKASSAAGSKDAGHSVNYNVSYISKDGAAGRAVTGITEYYKATNSNAEMPVPTSDSGWSTNPNVSNWGANAKYLWNYEKVTYSSGTTVERTKPQIVAIWTKDGKGIDSITNYYKITSSATAPSRPSTDGSDGWDDDPTAPGAGEYLWNYEKVTYTDGSVFRSEVQLIGYVGKNGASGKDGRDGVDGKDGKDGSPGHVGRWYYFAGDWNATTEYKFEATKAPYVKRGSNYYMLDCAAWASTQQSSATYIAKGSDTDPASHSSGNPWSPMTAVFKYIITEAIFSGYAHLGSFIINGDWMISQCGMLKYYTSSAQTLIVTSDNCNTKVGSGVPYSYFKNSDPTGKDTPITGAESSWRFIPSFAVDGKTGKTYQNDAYVKGTINATSGVISGNVDVGTTGNKMQIYADETVGFYKRSGIKGMSGGTTMLDLGFGDNNYPTLSLSAPTWAGSPGTTLYPGFARYFYGNGSTIEIGANPNGKIHIWASPSDWPSRDQASIGEVFVGDDEILRVRLS